MDETTGTPAHEYAEHYGQWLAEKAAHEARVRFAEALARALVAVAMPPAQRLPTRESHEQHLAAVHAFALKLADIRGRVPGYQPNAIFRRWLDGAGVLLEELAHVA